MKLLAVDTATMLGGVAIIDDGRLVFESRLNVRITHSERVMREIDLALGAASMDIADIDVFGISTGPGSFTGLRVGLSTIKGLVYATGKKLVAVPTLECMAWNLPYSRHQVCPVLDARRKEVYAALFRWSGKGFERIIEEQTFSIERLLAMIDADTIFLGEGAILCRDAIVQKLGERAFFGAPQHMVPSAANVAFLCMKKAENGEYSDPLMTVPAYHRRSEAEIKLG
jgi:tRNA threonylcarbamoyladenosine biosynthesis protein TsaB